MCTELAISSNPKVASEGIQIFQKSIATCDPQGPLLIFVTKMQPFLSKLYDATIRATKFSESTQRLIAVARVFSGTLKAGAKVFVIGPSHTVENPDVQEVTIDFIFLMMGQQLTLLEEAGPGCIIGIGGLDDILYKTGTISSELECPNFARFEGISAGLMKVAIEPAQVSDLAVLREGLTLLARADPSLEFYTSKQGEDILSTCG